MILITTIFTVLFAIMCAAETKYFLIQQKDYIKENKLSYLGIVYEAVSVTLIAGVTPYKELKKIEEQSDKK